LPEQKIDHPLGCHRRRIPDRVVFEKLVEILVFGCAYWRIVDGSCSESTLPREKAQRVDRAWADGADHHDSPLLGETLDAVAESLGGVPERASVYLDRGYDSGITRERLQERGLLAEISQKGKPAPLKAGMRWVVERTNSWQSAHKKLVW
jgi:hypothetical protein